MGAHARMPARTHARIRASAHTRTQAYTHTNTHPHTYTHGAMRHQDLTVLAKLSFDVRVARATISRAARSRTQPEDKLAYVRFVA